jgi:hypothetical protein
MRSTLQRLERAFTEHIQSCRSRWEAVQRAGRLLKHRVPAPDVSPWDGKEVMGWVPYDPVGLTESMAHDSLQNKYRMGHRLARTGLGECRSISSSYQE